MVDAHFAPRRDQVDRRRRLEHLPHLVDRARPHHPGRQHRRIGGCKEKAWFGWPCDAKIEALRADFARETDLDKQKAIAGAIQQRAMDIVTYVPLGQYMEPIAYRDNLQGVIKAPVTLFWNISKK